MAKQINYIFICILTALCMSPAIAAEEQSEATENDSSSNAEELVLTQTEEINESISENGSATEQVEGDDDFVPSAQISEDLSVSFPVDI